MAKMAIYGHMASEPHATNIGKLGIPEKSCKNVAQQCLLEHCNALLADFIAKIIFLKIFPLKSPL